MRLRIKFSLSIGKDQEQPVPDNESQIGHLQTTDDVATGMGFKGAGPKEWHAWD